MKFEAKCPFCFGRVVITPEPPMHARHSKPLLCEAFKSCKSAGEFARRVVTADNWLWNMGPAAAVTAAEAHEAVDEAIFGDKK